VIDRPRSDTRGELRFRGWWRLLLVVGSLMLVALVAEAIARLVLPPQQLVEVAPVPTRERESTPTEEREQEFGIDVLLDWSGPHGVRLQPHVRATIRNHRVSGRDVIVETNSLGLRHSELRAKSLNEFRVLVLGDSITLGDYLPFEQTFPAQLERRLAGRETSVVVINGGLPGASTSDELYHYLEIRDAVDPDLVLLAMYLNDAQNNRQFYARSLSAPYASSRFLSWIVNRAELLRLRLWADETIPDIDPNWRERFRGNRHLEPGDMYNSRDGFDFEIYNAHQDFGLAWNSQSWKGLERITRTLSLSVRQEGGEIAAFLFPVHIQVKGSVGDNRPQRSFSRMWRSLDVAFLDLLPPLRADWQRVHRELYFDHCHLTAHGNAVVADALAEWLVAEELVPQ
jgi:lysophospholipase L1-like esterase